MFESLSKRLQATVDRLGRSGHLTERDVSEVMREVRIALLEADVSLPIVKSFVRRVRERAQGAEILRSLKPGQMVLKIVHEELITTLGEPGRLDFRGSVKPHAIMLVGLQGTGKTTTATKLAVQLRREGRSPMLVACDTVRPAAVDQLVTLARQVDVPYFEEGVGVNPASIAAHSLKAAASEGADVVILDTAGRLQINDDLMAELQEIKRRTSPAEILLVADAMTGQEAVNIAQGFNDKVGITGLILTKVDGDARGGAAISMRAVTGVPVKFLSTGEKIDGFEVFHPDRLASRILGMGDVLSLIERAQEEFDEAEAQDLQEKMLRDEFTLQEFLENLRRVRKMGPLGQLLNMVPGMGRLQEHVDQEEMEHNLRKVEAIILSMTPAERARPKLLNASRRKRIARGSGLQVSDVNQVVRQHRDMRKLMRQMRRGRIKMPGALPQAMGQG
ncbi:MAG: signal recognition particle protein [Anaerolineaceae bacterium]|nr:signal recognition particle protein [Anaerolineaceae bacterium]MDE0329823.1 signal recognition particle protein [Anaerolineaceae bacterium]